MLTLLSNRNMEARERKGETFNRIRIPFHYHTRSPFSHQLHFFLAPLDLTQTETLLDHLRPLHNHETTSRLGWAGQNTHDTGHGPISQKALPSTNLPSSLLDSPHLFHLRNLRTFWLHQTHVQALRVVSPLLSFDGRISRSSEHIGGYIFRAWNAVFA